jgi:diguanylate cyclase
MSQANTTESGTSFLPELQRRLDQALNLAARGKQSVGLFLIDVDNFLRVNAALGRTGGDELLRLLDQRIQNVVRRSDAVVKLDIDQYAVVVIQSDRTRDAAWIASRLNETLGEVAMIDEKPVNVTVSVGIALDADEGSDLSTLLQRAELAMRRVKARGGNGYEFANPETTRDARERLELERDLKLAIERNELYLVWQPQVNRTGDVVGVEALCRWHHANRGPIPPMTFIPIAEDTGQIVAIGNWVLHEAARQAREWSMQGLDLRVAVNVSPLQFARADFVESVRRALESSGCDASRLELEITEGLLMKNVDDAVEKLKLIRSMGIHIAVDDFGTGYSCLAYLHKLPLDSLKIDRSFVKELSESLMGEPLNPQTAVIRCVVAMADTLGLQLVAEGVETEPQRRYLHSLGCDIMQGYLFCRPAASKQIPDEVRRIRDRFGDTQSRAAA